MSLNFGTVTVAPVKENEVGMNRSPARRVAVLDGYELWAQSYDCDFNPLLALEEREVERLLPSLHGKDVLDAACGTGRWLEILLSRGARSGVGVDLTPAMLARAAAKPLLRRRLIRGDCLALPFRSRKVDVLVLSFSVGHIGDLRALASEIARVARPGAHLFVSDLHPLAHARGWRCAFRHAHEDVEIETLPHSLDEIRQAFASQGFELVGCHEPFLGEPEKRIFAQAGRSDLFEWACETPAIFICHFKSAGETGFGS